MTGDIDQAKGLYLDVISDIEGDHTTSPVNFEVLTACLNNLCAVYLAAKEFQGCIDISSKSIAMDNLNLKAHFRRAQARGKLEEFDLAIADLNVILKIEPSNKQAQDLLNSFILLDIQKQSKTKTSTVIEYSLSDNVSSLKNICFDGRLSDCICFFFL